MIKPEPTDLLELFQVGMDRHVQDILPETGMIDGPKLNLGAGNKMIVGTIPHDADNGWLAGEPLPYDDETVVAIFALHFFEHLTKEEFLSVLRECERVLVTYGVINVVVPHWSAEIAHQDLDHKLFFSEQTFENLFNNSYYQGTMPRNWKLMIHTSLIMGVVQRNLVLVTQLVKT